MANFMRKRPQLAQLLFPEDWSFLPAVLGTIFLLATLFAFYLQFANLPDEQTKLQTGILFAVVYYALIAFLAGFAILNKSSARHAAWITCMVLTAHVALSQFYHGDLTSFGSDIYVRLDVLTWPIAILAFVSLMFFASYFFFQKGISIWFKMVMFLGGIAFFWQIFGFEVINAYLHMFDKTLKPIGFIRKSYTLYQGSLILAQIGISLGVVAICILQYPHLLGKLFKSRTCE